MSDVALTGGCQCGGLRYRFDAQSNRSDICPCRMCQKASGGPFMAFVNLPASGFVVTRGEIASFASSGIAERGFCAECGTPLTYRTIGADRVNVTAGSLDNPNAVEPKFQIGVESRLTWLDQALALEGTPSEVSLARRNIAHVESRQHPDRNA